MVVVPVNAVVVPVNAVVVTVVVMGVYVKHTSSIRNADGALLYHEVRYLNVNTCPMYDPSEPGHVPQTVQEYEPHPVQPVAPNPFKKFPKLVAPEKTAA